MEGHELLVKMTKVKAPAGFEEGVLAKLPAVRAERARSRRRAFASYAFAGSAALILFAVLVLGPPRPEESGVLTYAEREALTATPGRGGQAVGGSRFVPVYETMDYASEYRNARPQPQTVYILEQVSETVPSEIIY